MGANVARRLAGRVNAQRGDKHHGSKKSVVDKRRRRPRRARRLRQRHDRLDARPAASRTVFSVAQPMLPIVGTSEMFPVRRIYCIGRNYAAHAREMGSDPTREPPFFFQKPSDAIQFVAPGTTADHPYPPLTKNYHYEIELVAALGKGGAQRLRPSRRSASSSATRSAST